MEKESESRACISSDGFLVLFNTMQMNASSGATGNTVIAATTTSTCTTSANITESHSSTGNHSSVNSNVTIFES